MAGYTDGFTKVNGELIDATDFEQEYTALENAFNTSSGHKHDGTVAEGPLIALIGASATEVLCDGVGDQIVFSVNVAAVKTAQVSIADGAILPDTTNDVDLGSPALKFKDAHFAGNVNATGDVNVATDANVTGNVNATNANIAGNINLSGVLVPTVTNTSDLGSLALKFKDAHFAGNVNATGDVNVASNVNATGDVNVAGNVNATNANIAGNINLSGVLVPTVTNTSDLGSLALKFKDAHFAGDVNAAGNINLSGVLVPTVTNTSDLGSPALKFKDAHFAGVANLTNLTLGSGTTVSSIIDDDAMTGNSNTALVTQGNVVAYVATEISTSLIDGGTF